MRWLQSILGLVGTACFVGLMLVAAEMYSDFSRGVQAMQSSDSLVTGWPSATSLWVLFGLSVGLALSIIGLEITGWNANQSHQREP